MRTSLVQDALKMAKGQRGNLKGAIFHSDHGSVYTSHAFQNTCNDLGIRQSMGAIGTSADNALAEIARQLVGVMRRDVRTDWTVREDVRAKLRSSVKRLLILNGYPPDKQPEAIKLVIEQMETMAQHNI